MSMNVNQENAGRSLETLKAEINDFIAQSSITNFEGDDIVELIREGETVDWMLDQLRSNQPTLDTARAASLLGELRSRVAPVAETIFPGVTPDAPPAADATDGSAPASETPGGPQADGSSMDLSQLDYNELMSALPPGMKLPPGLSLNKIKDILESPRGMAMSDFLLFCQERGMEVSEKTMSDPRMDGLRKEWEATPRKAFDGRTPAELLAGESGLMPEKVETFRHEEPRIGRNDPCPCGSGKKNKKCCGKNM